jgi:hypothetical protein
MAQRTKEIGIRMALGAGRADVSKLVILQTLVSILVSIAVGLTGALTATRRLRLGYTASLLWIQRHSWEPHSFL